MPTTSTLTNRLGRRAWKIAELVSTPLLPEDYLDLVDPLRSGAALRGRIVTVIPETRDAATIVIRPGRDWLPHAAGQYVRVGVDVGGVRQWRAYSLTSPIRPDGCITITVKAVPDGKVSNQLVRRSQPGVLVHLEQATGDFTLPTPLPQKVLFVTAGSGITPVMGMLRAHLDRLDDVVLIHSAPTAEDMIFATELRQLSDSGRLRLIERHTRADGQLSTEQLTAEVSDVAERQAWACGPGGLLDALEELYSSLGISEQLHVERFRTTTIVTGAGGEVTFTGSDSPTVVSADAATTLLDAGEGAGLLMPSGCRMGICFSCVLPLREGAVRDLRTGVLTDASEGDDILVQTCISAAAGPCRVQL